MITIRSKRQTCRSSLNSLRDLFQSVIDVLYESRKQLIVIWVCFV